jgi:hypothetical protein
MEGRMKNVFVYGLLLTSPCVMATDSAPAMMGGNGEPQACASTGVVKSADSVGGIHVRTGPGDEDLVFGFLPDGKNIWVCGREGNWVGIVYSTARDGACETGSPIDPKHPYRGKCQAGWVQESDIKQAVE